MGWNGRWQMRPGKRRKLEPESAGSRVGGEVPEHREHRLGPTVEHPFLKVKRVIGVRQGALPGLAKNTERLALLFGLGAC